MMAEDNRFLQIFREVGALWVHDENPERPYALLTSGKISNVFFNASKIIEQPRLLEDIADELTIKIRQRMHPNRFYPDAVVGPASGAITLAYAIARKLPSTRAWFTEPEGEGKSRAMRFKRFEPCKPDMLVFTVEDVVTTGSSVDASVKAVTDVDTNVHIYDWIGCVVNRSGHTTTPAGKIIVSLLEVDA